MAGTAPQRQRSRRGFTWLELLVAIFIVAMSGAIFAGLLPMAGKTQMMAGNYQQAASLLQHKLDQLRAVGYGRLNYDELSDAGIVDASPSNLPYEFDQVDNLTSVFKSATGTIAIATYSSDIKKVTVTITWSGSAMRQGNGTLSVEALIAKS